MRHTNAMSGPTSAAEEGQPGARRQRGWTISLDDAGSSLAGPLLVEKVGAKAGNLARARRAGLPVLPGVVLPADAAAAYTDGDAPDHDGVVANWLAVTADLSRSAGGPLVVRSTAPDEDAAEDSHAGRYTSILDVAGAEAVDRATRAVIASGEGAMAVLAQPLVVPSVAGVLFGMDPVTGRTDRVMVAAVPGLPDQLVSGRVSPTHYHLTRHGRVRQVDRHPDGPVAVLDGRTARRLARLAERVRRLFGSPQDVEWAIDTAGRLWLLQSRPITTRVPVPASKAVLGVAGVDETFPDRLAPLEVALWVPPLRDGVRHAVELTRAFPAKVVAASPVVTDVDGRVVADQLLVGRLPVRRHWFDPRPPMRRMSVAWRVGRLRGALVPLGARVVERADRSLSALPAPEEMSDEDLLGAVARAEDSLSALHGTEILAGMLLGSHADAAPAPSAIAEGLGLLTRARRAAAEDAMVPSEEALVAAHPVLLALSPPRIGSRAPLPPSPAGDEVIPAAPAGGAAAAAAREGRRSGVAARAREVGLVREALRLRARWVQEAQAAMIEELARRLRRDGLLGEVASVRMMTLDELGLAVRRGRVPADLVDRTRRFDQPVAALPATFRLSTDGRPIAVDIVVPDGEGSLRGTGAGGGQGRGPVAQDPSAVVAGDVLVTATLEPRLASLLPVLSGLVAETGSPLSHLAIVAREHGVPTVVAVAGARDQLPVGSVVMVDGATGSLARLDDPGGG